MEFNNIQEIIDRSQEFDQTDKELIKNDGVVFTLQDTCNQIINLLDPKINETVCEPSVGRGSFVFSLLERFRKDHPMMNIVYFIENKLHCYDINADFISDLRIMLQSYVELIGYDEVLNLDNIRCEDFLLQGKTWDVILGNPPYIRIQNLEKEYLDLLRTKLKSLKLGNVNLYYAFLEKSLSSSNRVGFIIPNSFIKTKSGKTVRQIIKNRITYIYDFCNHTVWEKIATYTSILICGKDTTDSLIYETKDDFILKDKSELSDDVWIFSNEHIIGEELMMDMVHYSIGGIATIKDGVYKMDSDNEDYCFKNGYILEKGICKKTIKGTTAKNFNDHKWILYPYDHNGKVLSESYIQDNFPLAYIYLIHQKEILNTRDKGKTSKYDAWYAYGRRQGLLKDRIGRKIILPLTFLESRGIHYIEIPEDDECLVLSGILIDVKEEHFDEFINLLSSKEFYKHCEVTSKTLKDKNLSDDIWLTINMTSLKTFKY